MSALLALVLATPLAVATRAVEVRWQPASTAPGAGEVRVDGLPAAALARLAALELDAGLGERVLRVVVAGGDADPRALAGLPQLWGSWRVDAGELVFRPRHTLGASTVLFASFDGASFDALGGTVGTASGMLRHAVASGDSVARVVAVSPGGEVLPANLLRLYVEFSHPMSMRDVERHVRLLGDDGVEIGDAFAPVPGGLWDPTRRRLTLIVHPGRVKSGLGLGERLGPVLASGQQVTLTVAPAARDAEGRPLQTGFSRSWRVGPPQRAPIDLATWSLAPPATPRDPLVVRLPWPLDRAIAARALSVQRADGERVPVELTFSPDERELRFAPATAWVPGARYRLRAEPYLEDASGNRPGRPFERAVGAGAAPATSDLAFVAAAGLSSPPR